ncbi:MAG: O-antigen ligase family protein [Salinivirgaceae bacterium]|nr:O-antigen ligase family protein [Salinivirgaceae bacterium]
MKLIKKIYEKINWDIITSLEWFVISCFLISLPFVYTTKLIDAVLRSRFLDLSIVLLVLTGILVYKFYKRKFTFYFSKVDILVFGALALFLVVNIISGFSGVINQKEAIVQIFREITLALMFFYFYQFLRNKPKGKDVVIKAVLVMTFFYLLIGFIQLSKADFTQFIEADKYYGYYLRQSISHVKSTLASINLYASFLYLSLAFSTYGVIAFKKFWRIFSVILIVGAIFFIFLLASKASWGALGIFVISVSILIYFYLFSIRPKETGRPLSVWLSTTLLLIPFLTITAGVYVVEKTDIQIVNVVIDKVQQVLKPELCLNNIYNSDNPTTTQTRTLVWGNTLQMAKDNPLLGVGPGQWRIEYAKYGIDGFEHNIRNGTTTFQRTHNDFFWIMGETGFTGLILYLLIYITILFTAFKSFINNSDLKVRLAQGVFFSILLGFILILFVSFPRERITHNVIYLLIFALVLFLSDAKNLKLYAVKSNLYVLLISIALIVISGFNIKIAKNVFDGEVAARTIRSALVRKNFHVVMRAAKSVDNSYYTLDNFTGPMAYYKGVAYSNTTKDMKQAQKSFTEAYELHPYHLPTLNNLATSCELLGQKEKAIEIYNKALAISPRYKEALINKSIVLFNLNKFDEALQTILQIPFYEKNPEKFELTVVTICRKKSTFLLNRVDVDKLKVWFQDENKIKATFVKIQKGNLDFNKTILEEFGK